MMNDTWKRIFKKYIACNNAIDTLSKSGIITNGDEDTLKLQLLDDIIVTMKSEVEE